MPTPAQRSVKQIVLLSLGTVMIGSSLVFSFWVLGSVGSRVVTNVVYYYNSMLKQQSPLPE